MARFPGLDAFNHNGELLAGADPGDNSIKLWDVADRTAVGSLAESDSGAVSAVAFSPDGGTLATTGRSACGMPPLSSPSLNKITVSQSLAIDVVLASVSLL